MATVTQVITANTTWTCPFGVSQVNVTALGGGGGGGGTAAAGSGGGGAGGQCVVSTGVAVTAGTGYAVVVGGGGAGGAGAADGTAGSDTTFAATTVVAKGGAGGKSLANGAAGGAGSTSGATGTTVYAGGNGSAGGSSAQGGAGGGGAGTTGAGGNASGTTGGLGTCVYGGGGAAGVTSSGNGANGPATTFLGYGGGGSGGYNSSGTTSRTGGTGTAGAVLLTWTAPSSPYVNENFDSATPPALPTGYGGILTTGGAGFTCVTTSSVSYSGANSLQFSGLSSARGFAYWPQAFDGNAGNTQIEVKWRPSSVTGVVIFFLYLRSQGAPSGTTQPLTAFKFQGDFGGTGANWVLQDTDGSGAATTLVTNSSLGITFTAGAWYRCIFSVQTSDDSFYVRLAGYVQRMSDNAWLLPSGSWQTGVQVPCICYGGAPISSTGWATGSIPVIGVNLPVGVSMFADDVLYSATAAPAADSPSNPPAAGNEVELIGTYTGSDAGTVSHDITHLNAGFGQWYQSTAIYFGSVKVDAAVNVTPTAMLYAPPRSADSTYGVSEGFEQYLLGAQVQGATASSGPWTLLGTLATNRYPEPNVMNTLRLDYVGNPGPYRYFRLLFPQEMAAISQFRMIVQWTNGISWKPCRPIISPAAGRYAVGQTVTITSNTGTVNGTATQLYYTTDGTTPTLSGGVPQGTTTLYSGPVTIPSNAPAQTQIQAIAYNAGATTTASDVTTGYYTVAQQLVPDTGNTGQAIFGNGSTDTWPDDSYDDRGILVQSNAPSIGWDTSLGRYRLMGTNCNSGNVTGAGNIGGAALRGLIGYQAATQSAHDFFNWQYLGQLLMNPPAQFYKLAGSAHLTVAHILRNPNPLDPNKRYVLWAHVGAGAISQGLAGCATAPAFAGPWTWQWVYGPGGVSSLGCTLFYDVVDDGTGNSRNKAWLAFSSGAGNVFVGAVQLDPLTDWTSPTGQVLTILPVANREGTVLFWYNSFYYMIFGQNVGYGSGNAQTQYRSAAALTDLASATDHSVWASAPATTSVAYNAQPQDIVPVSGLVAPAFVLLADLEDAGASVVNIYNARTAMWPLSSIAGGNKVNAFPSPGVLSLAAPTSWDLTYLPSASVAGTLSDTPSTVDSVSSVGQFFRTLSDSPPTVDTVSRILTAQRAPLDSPSTTDAVSPIIQIRRTVSDTPSTADSVTAIKGRVVFISDSPSTIDSVSASGPKSISLADASLTTDIVAAVVTRQAFPQVSQIRGQFSKINTITGRYGG